MLFLILRTWRKRVDRNLVLRSTSRNENHTVIFACPLFVEQSFRLILGCLAFTVLERNASSNTSKCRPKLDLT